MEKQIKASIRVSTDQYEYIELELEDSMDEIWSKYRQLKSYAVHGRGIPNDEFNSFVDGMLLGKSNHVEVYMQMNDSQKEIVQCIKRGLKRIKDK